MVMNLEKIPSETRRYVFMGVTALSSLFLFEPFTSLVSWIVDWKLEEFPIFGVRNILGFLIFVLFIAITYRQVD